MRGTAPIGFVARGTSLEPMAADLGTDQTPLADFFVCKAGDPVAPDPDTWQLTIGGDAVDSEATFRLADLQSLPQHHLDAWLECAGNGRALFGLLGPQPLAPAANNTPWMLGAMGMARWAGPTLHSVLERAGLTSEAAWVSPVGLDVHNTEGEPVRMCLPIDKALHPDTIVALEMNDAPLEPMHGFPARLLVPGWVGAYSVKWLDRIDVSTTWVPSWRADTFYRLRTPEGADLGPATVHPVKSSLALPWPARMSAGPVHITGYARAAGLSIDRVEWRVDDRDWTEAELIGPNGDWTWSPFRFEWTATPGRHVLRTRATDVLGNRQPDDMPFHRNGILWNGIIPHPVEVS